MELTLYIILIFLGIIMVLLGLIIREMVRFFKLARTVIDKGFMKKFDIVFDYITNNNSRYEFSVDGKGKVKKEMIDGSY